MKETPTFCNASHGRRMSSIRDYVEGCESEVSSRFESLWQCVRRERFPRREEVSIVAPMQSSTARIRRFVVEQSEDEETASFGPPTEEMSTGSMDDWIVADHATAKALEAEDTEDEDDDIDRWAARGAELLRELRRRRPNASEALATSSPRNHSLSADGAAIDATPMKSSNGEEQDEEKYLKRSSFERFYATAGWGTPPVRQESERSLEILASSTSFARELSF